MGEGERYDASQAMTVPIFPSAGILPSPIGWERVRVRAASHILWFVIPGYHFSDFHRRAALGFAFIRCFHKSEDLDGFFRRHWGNPCAEELHDLSYERSIAVK